MGKVSVIKLNPDMTFEEKRKKTSENVIEMKGVWKPNFKIGRSVFRELVSKWKFWKKSRNIVIVGDGFPSCFEMYDSSTKELDPNFGTMKDKQRFVSKLIAKSKSEQKTIDTTHFIIIMVGIAFLAVLQFLVLKGWQIG